MPEAGPTSRDAAADRLDGASVDLLVIGAGAIGAATAWLAAEAGATVAVVDRSDLAGATSSASSKLLHGGLRYLAMGDIGLVREAHSERRANARIVAPHLVVPQPFIVPILPGGPLPGWKGEAGVLLYGLLSGFADGRSGRIRLTDARRLAPGLAIERLRGAVRYHDHRTHDGRLTLAALTAAARRGAIVAPRVEVVALETRGGHVSGARLLDVVGGRELRVTARAVVNATGPWVDHVRRLEDPDAIQSVRLSKGAHVVLAARRTWRGAVTTPLPEGRVSFAIPWEGQLLLGTTDEEYDGDPADVAPTDADVAQILSEAALTLEPDVIDPALERSRFAGLRVLPLGNGSTTSTRRETVVTRGPAGMLSVAGGKLTTWRRIGLRVATEALADIGGGEPPAAPIPLPGAASLDAAAFAIRAAYPELPDDVVRHLASHHGTAALDLLLPLRATPSLATRLHPDGPDIEAQVVHAAHHEWATEVDDVLRRRTTVWFRGLATPAVRERVAELLREATAVRT